MASPPPSRLDANQVLKGSYDEDRGRLRVDAEATVVNADIDVALDATEDNVAIADPDGDFLDIKSDGSITTRIVDEVGSAFTDTNYVPVGQTTHDNLNANANVQQNNTDVSVANPLFTQTTNGNLETTQQTVLTELQSVNTELDSQTAQLVLSNSSLDDIEARLETFDTNAGVTGANTLRTTSNITRNGNELSYNQGASNTNTLRVAANLADESGSSFTDTNYVPVGQTTHDNLNLNANAQQNNADVSVSNPLFIQTTNGALATKQNPLDKYRIADEDSLGLTKYYGFASSTSAGSWVILKQDTTTSPYTYRYANVSNNVTRTDYGAAGATGAWANRATLTYNYLYVLTGV